MVLRICPFATVSREPRQARKGATVTVDPGAGVRRVRGTTRILQKALIRYQCFFTGPRIWNACRVNASAARTRGGPLL